MTDKKDKQELTNDIMMADIMLRVTAIEKLLIEKGVFTQEELTSSTEEIAKRVAKVVIERAQASKNIEEFIADLEASDKEKERPQELMQFITQEEELQIDLPLQALYFYASWMPYHNKFLTMISKIEEKHKDISFFAVDVDAFPNQCKRFAVNSVPEVLVLKGGKEVKRISGLVLTSAFRSTFADICNS